MKYIYIICLALSSLFAHGSVNADIRSYNNAFFIPGGAFQQNTQVKQLRPAQPAMQASRQNATKQLPSQPQQQITATTATTASAPVRPQRTTRPAKKQKAVNKTATERKTAVKQQTTAPAAVAKQPRPASKKQTKYKLDDTPAEKPAVETVAAVKETPPLEKFQQKSINEMLNTLPYPDFKQPKFKQIYALYALELRSAYRRGKLPPNREQEETLAKANSIRRFEVK